MVYYHLTLSPWLRAWMWEIHYKDRASACAAWNHDPTRKVMNVQKVVHVVWPQSHMLRSQLAETSHRVCQSGCNQTYAKKVFWWSSLRMNSAISCQLIKLTSGGWQGVADQSLRLEKLYYIPVISMQSAMQWFTQRAIIIGTNVCVHICHHLKDMPFGVLHVEIKSPFALRDDVITPTHCVSHHVVVA